jgi:acetyltransferase
MCFIDYDRQMALVAGRPNIPGSVGEIIGVGRLIKLPGENRAEVAIIVSDAFQKRGIGSALVGRLINFARDEEVEVLTASFLAENQAVAELFRSQGFTLGDGDEPEVRQAELWL